MKKSQDFKLKCKWVYLKKKIENIWAPIKFFEMFFPLSIFPDPQSSNRYIAHLCNTFTRAVMTIITNPIIYDRLEWATINIRIFVVDKPLKCNITWWSRKTPLLLKMTSIFTTIGLIEKKLLWCFLINQTHKFKPQIVWACFEFLQF